MAPHEKFSFKTISELHAKLVALGIDLSISEETDIFGTPAKFGRLEVPNRLAILPMEGCDGEADGSPGELTRRRYERFGAGGSGLIWVEACAVVPEGRANPRQLWINEENLDSYRQLVELTHRSARESAGIKPQLLLQLTHSGRYSRPVDKPKPLLAQHSKLDELLPAKAEAVLVSDEYLEGLQEAYVRAARLAEEAGFDGVDVKACHGYLMAELLEARTRESVFGGSFEHRTRFLLEVVRRIRREVSSLEVTSRLNLYDGFEYPYGWGIDEGNARKVDLAEPLRLVELLAEAGCRGLSTTMGNPYVFPHLGRPYDRPDKGAKIPEEHPLEGVARLIFATRELQQRFPDMVILGGGYSWLRHFFPNIAAGLIEQGWVSLVGLGRGAIAYPDFVKDILQTGRMEAKKCCITCSGCTQLMRDKEVSGCIVRDKEVYSPIYRRARQKES